MPTVIPETNKQILKSLQKEVSQSRKQGNSRMALTYSRAVKSIRLYPLRITSGSDALKLNGVGRCVADRIDKILAEAGLVEISEPLSVQSVSSSVQKVAHVRKRKRAVCEKGCVQIIKCC
jgi:hypothetical protein